VLDLGYFAIAMLVASLLLLGLSLIVGLLYSRTAFVEHWMPAFVAGLFLIGIVPVANSIYWVRQKDFEGCVQDRDKRYELLASTARTYTNLFKVHTELAYLSRQIAAPAMSALRADIRRPSLEALVRLKSELAKERIRLESQIGADSALMNRYLPGSHADYNAVALNYDDHVKPGSLLDPTRDTELVRAVNALVRSMEKEARSRECQ
jgi:hypothetical protein